MPSSLDTAGNIKQAKSAVRRTAALNGFTLIEITIVLLIAGLLVTVVVKGQSMLQSVQTKNILAIIKDLSTASQSFRERYHYLPGDFPLAAAPNAEIPNLAGACADGGNGDGVITTSELYGVLTITESSCAPAHLFNAGLIRGGAGAIQSSFGAVRLIGNSVTAGSVVAAGANPVPANIRNLIEFTNLPCDIAMEVDLKLDDGNLSTGNARASVTSCTSGAAVPGFAIPL